MRTHCSQATREIGNQGEMTRGLSNACFLTEVRGPLCPLHLCAHISHPCGVPPVCVIAQSCSTLCDSLGYSPRGTCVHRIFQARVLEWVAISFFNEKTVSPFLFKMTLFLYLFLAVLGCLAAFGLCSSCGERGLPSCEGTWVAAVAGCRCSCWGTRA